MSASNKQPHETHDMIDDILDKHFEHGAFNPATKGDQFKRYRESYRKEAKAQIEKMVAEIIGEDSCCDKFESENGRICNWFLMLDRAKSYGLTIEREKE